MTASRFRGEYIDDRKELHNAVRAEAGNRCVRCKHPEGDRQIMTTDQARVDELEKTFANVTVKPHHFDADDVMGWRVVIHSPCTDDCTHAEDGKIRVLTVHHLDGHKANNAWWNLLALCQVCHLQIQARVIPERPWLFAHTEWFVPYVCGFYAAYYGNEDITREQADADPHRYLAMGQPWLYRDATP